MSPLGGKPTLGAGLPLVTANFLYSGGHHISDQEGGWPVARGIDYRMPLARDLCIL